MSGVGPETQPQMFESLLAVLTLFQIFHPSTPYHYRSRAWPGMYIIPKIDISPPPLFPNDIFFSQVQLKNVPITVLTPNIYVFLKKIIIFFPQLTNNSYFWNIYNTPLGVTEFMYLRPVPSSTKIIKSSNPFWESFEFHKKFKTNF